MTDNNQDVLYPGNDNLCKISIHPGLFTADECSEIVLTGEVLPGSEGLAGLRDEVAAIRKSTVRWLTLLPETKWIFERIHGLVMQRNAVYQFALTGFREPLQIASYSGEGHYGWHVDLGEQLTATRKLSISIQLTDPSSYDGGDLEFWNMGSAQSPREIGTAIVFPSYLMHRVRPVTRGMRQSLVAWVHGPSFQ